MQRRNQTGTGTTTEGRSGPPGRARYLKAELRVIFQLPCKEAVEAIDKWVVWARRCRILAFVKLQRTIIKHRGALLAAIEHGLSNGRVESMNTKFRLITRIAFGFTSPHALIALAMLSLGGHETVLPARKGLLRVVLAEPGTSLRGTAGETS